MHQNCNLENQFTVMEMAGYRQESISMRDSLCLIHTRKKSQISKNKGDVHLNYIYTSQ